MILGMSIADIIIGIVALILVGLCIYTIFKKRKKCCSKCSGCPYLGKCGNDCECK